MINTTSISIENSNLYSIVLYVTVNMYTFSEVFNYIHDFSYTQACINVFLVTRKQTVLLQETNSQIVNT